jgi:hypothetical protein
MANASFKKKVINIYTKEILPCAKLISGIKYGTLKDGLRKNLCYYGWSYRVDFLIKDKKIQENEKEINGD